jgi:ABC-type phosphate transport system substrate-binding protein
MSKLIKLLSGVAAAATVAAITAGPALADPIGNNGKPVTPAASDVVGVGSDTIEYLLDQISVNYNATHSGPHLYSWDATNPTTGAVGDKIALKSGCTKIARPNGSSAGISALDNNTKDGASHFCIDYARSSRGRAATDPAKGPGGILFVALAKDAVTYATRTASHGGTDAPGNLSTAQLTKIYTCAVKNWNQVGGKNAAIHPFLPQTGSGTRAFFLKAINVTTPGTCVNSSVQENEGTNKLLNSANAIVPFSIAKYIAEVYHSAPCGKKPTGTQNRFGCDTHGVLGLNKIDGKAPTTGKAPNVTINPGFSTAFIRTVYDVVRYAGTPDHIPGYLERFFASKNAKAKGYACNTTAGTNAIKNYGFLPTPLCGSGS